MPPSATVLHSFQSMPSYPSDGTIHEIEASLTVGKAYTLHEETAPAGYLKAADIIFSVDESGKVSTTAEVETADVSDDDYLVYACHDSMP